ncbi:uncharacterized protein LOC130266487 [Oenanthe melanoleuca]|uniref:uncharacterized protein LOC130266487 n=1 Tax=Oenanthe melanoleuca TaxID=2939378 RepID=UPI0024C149C8|nr:uncharacterized protein LOC130266487 [Oenanthe melanoleuca]
MRRQTLPAAAAPTAPTPAASAACPNASDGAAAAAANAAAAVSDAPGAALTPRIGKTVSAHSRGVGPPSPWSLATGTVALYLETVPRTRILTGVPISLPSSLVIAERIPEARDDVTGTSSVISHPEGVENSFPLPIAPLIGVVVCSAIPEVYGSFLDRSSSVSTFVDHSRSLDVRGRRPPKGRQMSLSEGLFVPKTTQMDIGWWFKAQGILEGAEERLQETIVRSQGLFFISYLYSVHTHEQQSGQHRVQDESLPTKGRTYLLYLKLRILCLHYLSNTTISYYYVQSCPQPICDSQHPSPTWRTRRRRRKKTPHPKFSILALWPII